MHLSRWTQFRILGISRQLRTVSNASVRRANFYTMGSSALPFTLRNPEVFHNKSYIGGEWVESKGGKRFEIVDPGTGKAWTTAPTNTVDDVHLAVQTSYKAFDSYRKVLPRTRAQWIFKWDALIKKHRDDLAQILTWETGKPLAEAYGEIDYAVSFTWWFGGEAERIQGTTLIPSTPNRRVLTTKQPIGVCVALVPWNFPVAMILRKVGAALAAGCTMIVKPSPETPLSTLTLAHLATQAGFPPGVLNVLTTDLENTPSLSEMLCKHPLVSKVTFTGSSAIGKLIARHCSYGLKKVSLELGGNCPYIIFDDANLQQALTALMALKWRHAGQACVTANRVYLQHGVYDQFVAMFAEETKKLKIGHGTEPGTTFGPVTTPRGISKVISQVEDAQKHGGEIVTGGKVFDHLGGYYYEPTIVKNANDDMLITHEESFSPVIAFYPFDTEDEVVVKANNTSMGLASYFFTKDVDRTFRLMENLEAGMIAGNTGNSSASEVPFGGMKESGYGKESGKDVAVNEYLMSKTVTLTLEGHW